MLVDERDLMIAAESEVTKIGRTYLTVASGYRYHLDTGYGGGSGYAFTPKGLNAERKHEELVREVSTRSNQIWKLTTPQLRKLLSWLKEGA